MFEAMRSAVMEGKADEAEALAKKMLDEGVDAMEIIDNGCVPAIEKAGELFAAEQFFLPQLMMAAEAMKAVTNVVEPVIKESQTKRKTLGKVVIGTVEGDIHDIGKSIVGSMLSASGFDVVDLGVDVPSEKLVEEAKKESPCILGLSALLTNAMQHQRTVVDLLKEEGIRDKVTVLVGGAPVTAEWAKTIGADGYAENAVDAVGVAKSMVK